MIAWVGWKRILSTTSSQRVKVNIAIRMQHSFKRKNVQQGKQNNVLHGFADDFLSLFYFWKFPSFLISLNTSTFKWSCIIPHVYPYRDLTPSDLRLRPRWFTCRRPSLGKSTLLLKSFESQNRVLKGTRSSFVKSDLGISDLPKNYLSHHIASTLISRILSFLKVILHSEIPLQFLE